MDIHLVNIVLLALQIVLWVPTVKSVFRKKRNHRTCFGEALRGTRLYMYIHSCQQARSETPKWSCTFCFGVEMYAFCHYPTSALLICAKKEIIALTEGIVMCSLKEAIIYGRYIYSFIVERSWNYFRNTFVYIHITHIWAD